MRLIALEEFPVSIEIKDTSRRRRRAARYAAGKCQHHQEDEQLEAFHLKLPEQRLNQRG
jgi:hypothetical protein